MTYKKFAVRIYRGEDFWHWDNSRKEWFPEAFEEDFYETFEEAESVAQQAVSSEKGEIEVCEVEIED